MSRLMKTGLGAIVLAGSALLLGSSGGARADTITDYTLAYCDGGSSYCGGSGSGLQSGTYGTVVVDVATGGGSATITYTLSSGVIADPTANASAVFDLSGTISSYSVTSDTGCGTNGCGTWSVPTGSSYTVDESNSPGFGNFPEGVSCSTSYNFSTHGDTTCGTTIVITVDGTNLAVASNDGPGSASYFAALDVDPISTNPEVATGSPTPGAVPLPGALAMLAPVLGGGFLALRKRRRQLSAAAA